LKAIRVSILIPASLEKVWAEVERIEEHPRWMADAIGIEFEDDRRRGVGTRIRVATKIGPFRTTDVMEFTEWESPRAMGVTHTGLFTGTGRFTLEPSGDGTKFTWTETVRFPWYLGGRVGAFIARPVLATVWKANLRGLALRITGP
jgi:carbon monoxide dehydrogenase subunit G